MGAADWDQKVAMMDALGIAFCDSARREGCIDRPYIGMTQDGDPVISGIAYVDAGDTVLSEAEFIDALLCRRNLHDHPTEIGGHPITYKEGGDIRVGCTKVPFDTLKAIYKEAKRRRNDE